jgi:hypothetical protein
LLSYSPLLFLHLIATLRPEIDVGAKKTRKYGRERDHILYYYY